VSDNPTRVTIRTPAKINLGLRVLGKRSDGFHDIETLFVAISLFDELSLQRRNANGVTLTWEKGRDDLDPGDFNIGEKNLIVRAIREFERSTGETVNVGVHLKKSIPIAAGLGGGSSDAAATLLGLSKLYPQLSSRIDLSSLAARIGSDIPFFLGAPAAIGRGRGEVLSPASIDLTWYAILICPRIASPTPDVYAALDLTSLPRMPHFPARLEGDGFFAALALIHNDLQDVVERRAPEVLHWHNRLLTLGAEGAYVSGSGPSVFGIFRHEPDSATIVEIRAEGADAWVVRPLDTQMTMVIGLS
jgi:4-diphosphocytidyl-2-C-methyl-D-erythritol kinase